MKARSQSRDSLSPLGRKILMLVLLWSCLPSSKLGASPLKATFGSFCQAAEGAMVTLCASLQPVSHSLLLVSLQSMLVGFISVTFDSSHIQISAFSSKFATLLKVQNCCCKYLLKRRTCLDKVPDSRGRSASTAQATMARAEETLPTGRSHLQKQVIPCC